MKLFDKVSLSLSRLVNAAPVPPYKYVQDMPQDQVQQSTVPGTVQVTPFVHVPADATRFLKELSRIGFDLSKKVDIGKVLDLLPEEIFEPLIAGMPVNDVSNTHKDVFMNWWIGTGQEDINQLNISIQQHNIQSPDKDVSTMPVRRGPETYPLDPTLYQKDWVPERDDPGYGKPLGWLEDFNKKSFIRVSLKKIASEFDNWLRSIWPTMAWLKVNELGFDSVVKIFNILAKHSPDQAKNIQQLLLGGEESFQRAISPLQSDISDVPESPQTEETLEQKVLRQDQESLKNVDIQDKFMQRNKERLDLRKQQIEDGKRLSEMDNLTFQYRYILLGQYLQHLRAFTGMNVGSYDINQTPDTMINYMLGVAANIGPGVSFMDGSGSGDYVLKSDQQVKNHITECFGALKRIAEVAGGKDKDDQNTLSFIKSKVAVLDSMAKDFDAKVYPFMYLIRNQFLQTARADSLPDMKRLIANNPQLAENAASFYSKSSKNFPGRIIDPDEIRSGAGVNEYNQVKKLVEQWKVMKPHLNNVDLSNVKTTAPAPDGDQKTIGDATQNDFDSVIKRDERISDKIKKKIMDPIPGFTEGSIYNWMLQQYNMEDNETIGMVYAPGKLRDGGRPSMPAKTGMWLRNFGSDNGLEGVVIGVEGDAIAVFIPGQGYNRPTGWLPQECEVSMKQVKPSW